MQQLQCIVCSSTNKFMVNVSVYVLFCYELNECITNALESQFSISLFSLLNTAAQNSVKQNHTSSGVDSDPYTIHFIRFATASVILMLHKSSVHKKLILRSCYLLFVRFCSSKHRSKAKKRTGASFRLNESVESWFKWLAHREWQDDLNCRKIVHGLSLL